MTEFKNKMQQEVRKFNTKYETRLKNFQSKKAQINQTINKLKHRQAQESTQSPASKKRRYSTRQAVK